MQPFLLYGSSSKERKSWADGMAKKNDWIFMEISTSSFEEDLYKASITGNLDGKPNVIFIHSAENLKEKDLTILLDYSKNSPHRFILSSKSLYKIPKGFRDKFHTIRIGEVPPDEFFEAINKIMMEPDREAVREYLEKEGIEVEAILHILKNNIWKVQNQQAYEAVETCFSLLYKVPSFYLTSMLSYLYPVCRIPLTFEAKRKLYKEQSSIMSKLRRRFRLNFKESVETYQTVQEILAKKPSFGFVLAKDLELDEKERAFLGIKEQQVQSTPPPNFSSSGLEKWL